MTHILFKNDDLDQEILVSTEPEFGGFVALLESQGWVQSMQDQPKKSGRPRKETTDDVDQED